jgi:DNA processing protein
LDLILVSGLARGIDSEVHRAALRAHLPTVAIIGSGLDALYPPENRKLAQEIVEAGGLLLSEQDLAAPAKGFHFLRRNRLLAAWSRCTCVIEAPARSGTLNTARWARDLDRLVFAVPSFPGDSAFLGNQSLLEKHEAIPLWSPDELGLVWSEIPSHLALQRKRNPPRKQSLPLSPRAEALAHEVALRTQARGGAEILALLDWALTQNWRPSEFYQALQELLDSGDLKESQGVLLKNDPREV